MKLSVFGLLAFSVPACAGETPPAASQTPASPSPAARPSSADDPTRALTKAECQSLGQWMADACASRPNERSARVEGWCSDILRGVGDGTWVSGDCMKNIKYIDSVCFRGTTKVFSMMDCDYSVHRP